MFQVEPAAESLYKASIGGIRFRLQKLQEEDIGDQKIRSKNKEEINRMLHHQSLSYIPELIKIKLISKHYNDLLDGHFGFEKTRELIA